MQNCTYKVVTDCLDSVLTGLLQRQYFSLFQKLPEQSNRNFNFAQKWKRFQLCLVRIRIQKSKSKKSSGGNKKKKDETQQGKDATFRQNQSNIGWRTIKCSGDCSAKKDVRLLVYCNIQWCYKHPSNSAVDAQEQSLLDTGNRHTLYGSGDSSNAM